MTSFLSRALASSVPCVLIAVRILLRFVHLVSNSMVTFWELIPKLGNLPNRATVNSAETGPSTKMSDVDNHRPPFEPSILDVVVVKAMLTKALHLPPEIVDVIVDQAEYWPHTSTEVLFGADPSNVPRIVGLHEKDAFLLRTIPLGFAKWPSQGPSAQNQADVHRSEAPPKLPGQPLPAEIFQRKIDSPVTTVVRPCRKVVFTIRSHDQGWGGRLADCGTYHGSWTWFEAGLERWCCADDDATRSNDQAEVLEEPSFTTKDICTIHPTVVSDGANHYIFDHPLLPLEDFKIQCNVTVSSETKEHRVVWSHNDTTAPETPEKAAEDLASSGRGTGTGNGDFVRNLQLGDVITVWAKTRFNAWVNYVESVRVDVYWAI